MAIRSEIVATETWLDINRESLRGSDGRDGCVSDAGVAGERGPAGPRGAAGLAGATGSDGVGIALVEQHDEKSFWIRHDLNHNAPLYSQERVATWHF